MSFSNENTAAHNLHTLIASVRNSTESTIAGSWSAVLGAEWGTLEFTRRHTEVVSLLQLTMQQLVALPERQRARCERHVSAWWAAVIQPITNWMDETRPARSIIDDDKLDHLESTADLISGHLVGSNAAPRSTDLDQMRATCDEWIDLLTAMGDDEINGPVRDQLISQLRHVIWLVENSGIFGGARVAEEASTMIGALAQASASVVNMREESASRWKKAFLALVTACIVFNQASPIFQESITAGEQIVKEITSAISDSR
ncbi:hypothetical protein AB0B40_25620 [Streptomyces sp. NPDC042638]|uniref:hypothetical protein n=1 Tax=Streptomyces sp. NPDC042638 TaxID=3154333 RepID=UPI0033C3592B